MVQLSGCAGSQAGIEAVEVARRVERVKSVTNDMRSKGHQ